MILEARSSLRRWTTVTLEANLVRKVASSMAVSPPPTTTTSLSRKKKPSQVAQADTPKPMSSDSEGRPSSLAEAPEAMISASQVKRPLLRVSAANGREPSSTSVTSSNSSRAPKRSTWVLVRCISSGPMMPSGNPG